MLRSPGRAANRKAGVSLFTNTLSLLFPFPRWDRPSQTVPGLPLGRGMEGVGEIATMSPAASGTPSMLWREGWMMHRSQAARLV